MAGVKAAYDILSANRRKNAAKDVVVTIVEAKNYIGGRIRNFSFADDHYTVEMGANWISGLETTYDNPVWKLAQEISLAGHIVDRNEELAAQVVTTNGEDVAAEYFRVRQQFEACHTRAVHERTKRSITPASDCSVRHLLQQCGWPHDPNNMSPIEKTVEYNMLKVWVINSLSRLSVAHNMAEGQNDVDLGGEEFFVEDQRGFNSILNGMTSEIRAAGGHIHLNEEVSEIKFCPRGWVGVKTSSGKEYPAETIICTVSLGVLQSGSIQFSPPLPKWKTAAIDQLEMFLFSKVYAKFDHPFWKRQKNQIVICSPEGNRYPLWMRYRNSNEKSNSVMFLCYLGGDEAERVEALSNLQLQEEISLHFQNALGHLLDPSEDGMEVFCPSSVASTRWSTDPHFCGSYSTYPVHAFAFTPVSDLTDSLPRTVDQHQRASPILHFAGEAMDDQFNGWVQGAYRSGERVAKSILATLAEDAM